MSLYTTSHHFDGSVSKKTICCPLSLFVSTDLIFVSGPSEMKEMGLIFGDVPEENILICYIFILTTYQK